MLRGQTNHVAVEILFDRADLGHGPAFGVQRGVDQFRTYLSRHGYSDDVRSFTTANCLGFTQDLAGRGVKPNTIVCKLSALSKLAQFGMRMPGRRGRQVLIENPTRGFEWPAWQAVETHYLHPDELGAFLAAERPLNEHVARAVLLEMGIRVSEACALNVGDISEMAGSVVLAVRMKGRKRSGAEPTRLPVSRELAGILRDYLLARGMPGPVEPLLVDRRGTRWTRSGLTQLMQRIGKAAGITRLVTSAHRLRHTANVLARFAGIDPFSRSRLMGHASLRTLARYEHLVPGELAEARERQQAALESYLKRGASE